MTHGLDGNSQRFFDLAATGRPGPAVEYALGVTGSPLMTERFIADVVCPVLAHVGMLWQASRWSAAEEHAVTAVVDEVIGALAARTAVGASSRGNVLVVSVEGEHHTLAARIGVERLRLQGWDVTFLGGSLPRQAVVEFAGKAAPDVIVLSCTMARSLPAARRGIGSLAELGTPVVAAGAGYGHTPTRSDRLGASGWIGPTTDPSAVLEGRLLPPRAVHRSDAAAELDWHIDDLAAGTLEETYERASPLTSSDIAQVTSATDDLRDILRHLGASLELDDPSILDEYVTWLTATLSSRHVGPDVLAATLEVTAAVTDRTGFDQAAELLERARNRTLTTP